MKTRIFILFTLLCAGMTSLQAAAQSFTLRFVVNTNDSGPGSLRDALYSRVTTERLTVEIAVRGTITLTRPLYVPFPRTTIQGGRGANEHAVNGNHLQNVFVIDRDENVTISGLTITNGANAGISNSGTLTINNCIISGNSGYRGGGIANFGTLTVNDSTFSGNSATGAAGGIENARGARLTVSNSTISGNSATGGAGGIENARGATLTVSNSTISGNSASSGGGIASSGTVTVSNSTIGGNSVVDYGGGVWSDGTLTVSSSTISGNLARNAGGIYNVGATLTVSNSTVSGNAASSEGGGIYNQLFFDTATLSVSNSTLSDNSATFGGGIYNVRGTLRIGDTVLKAGSLGANLANNSGAIVSLGYNMSSDNGGGYLIGPGDQINTNPMLGPLQNNGGRTFTHALLQGSPAIDAGDPSFTPPPQWDQRGDGFARVANGRIDIGAFEVQ